MAHTAPLIRGGQHGRAAELRDASRLLKKGRLPLTLNYESDSYLTRGWQEESMRGSDMRTGELFSYVDLEKRVPEHHPLRLIRRIVNEVLADLDREFAELYAAEGRPSIAPERLLRALLLQAFYTIRSERQLMEQLHYNLLYRWFVGLGVDDPVWVPTVFTKNRNRLLDAEVARKFLAELLNHKEVRALLSDEHFSVDGTQIAAWASMKSFVAKDGSGEPPSPGRNGERDFHGERRSNETHASTTDPEAKLPKRARARRTGV
jgi:transposase